MRYTAKSFVSLLIVYFMALGPMPFALTEKVGARAVTLDLDQDERATELRIPPGSRCVVYFYLRSRGSAIHTTYDFYWGGYQLILKNAAGNTLSTLTLTTSVTDQATGACSGTLLSTSITSATRLAAVSMYTTGGTISVITSYFKISPQSVTKP
jgi:hypothetical protein